MKNLLPQITQSHLSLAKKIVYLGLIISWLVMPELLWHKLSFILHFVYESVAFLLEELLIHSFGMRKFYAQMMVFYLFFSLGLLALYSFWLRLPKLLKSAKAYFQNLGLQIKNQAIESWLALSTVQKAKFLIIQFAFTAGSFILLLS